MTKFDKRTFLESLSNVLDISPSNYSLAVSRYKSVANYLTSQGIDADFYTQGSFRLGTVIKPYRGDEDAAYDIDLVCQVQSLKQNTTPGELKKSIGEILNGSKVYGNLTKESRRCWTIEYAENAGLNFHMDVLPSVDEDSKIKATIINRIPEKSTLANSAIAITDKNGSGYQWSTSNPAGFADYFDIVNIPFINIVKPIEKQAIFENNRNLYASVEAVPDLLVRTALQRVIQILKYHRDVRFCQSPLYDDRPISMIITTLVAEMVSKHGFIAQDTYQLLKWVVSQLTKDSVLMDERRLDESAVSKMRAVRRDPSDKRWYIPNPVNPLENFADKWNEPGSEKAKAFFQWVKWVEQDIVQGLEVFSEPVMKSVLGEKVFDRVLQQYDMRIPKEARVTMINTPTSTNKPWMK